MSEVDIKSIERSVRRKTTLWFGAICALLALAALMAFLSLRSQVNRFALTAEQRLPSGVIEDQGTYWVMQLHSRRRADLASFDAKKSDLGEKLKTQKKEELRTKGLESLRAKASIRENKELLSYDNVARGNAPSDG